jgi:hypothetical protein
MALKTTGKRLTRRRIAQPRIRIDAALGAPARRRRPAAQRRLRRCRVARWPARQDDRQQRRGERAAIGADPRRERRHRLPHRRRGADGAEGEIVLNDRLVPAGSVSDHRAGAIGIAGAAGPVGAAERMLADADGSR